VKTQLLAVGGSYYGFSLPFSELLKGLLEQNRCQKGLRADSYENNGLQIPGLGDSCKKVRR
jgi:hypothetical protein